MTNPRIGLVLGAGGTPGGFFLRAAMETLTEVTGWVPAMSATIVGTSAGALNAARVDPRPVLPSADIEANLARLARTLAPPPRSIAERLIVQPRTVLGRAVGRFARTGTNRADYPVAQAPFHPAVRVVSCVQATGSRRITILSEADDVEAELYASAAVPGFSMPVELDGVTHVDGAVWSTTNADVVTAADHDVLIVIAPMVPRDGGSIVQVGHRASVLSEMNPWMMANRPALLIAPRVEALANRADHEAFGADARRQILQAYR